MRRSPPRRRRLRPRDSPDASGADASTGVSPLRGTGRDWPEEDPRPRPPRRRRLPPPELVDGVAEAGTLAEGTPGRVSPIWGAGRVSPIRGLDDEADGLLVSSLTTGTPRVLVGGVVRSTTEWGDAARAGVGDGCRTGVPLGDAPREEANHDYRHLTAVHHVVLIAQRRRVSCTTAAYISRPVHSARPRPTPQGYSPA